MEPRAHPQNLSIPFIYIASFIVAHMNAVESLAKIEGIFKEGVERQNIWETKYRHSTKTMMVNVPSHEDEIERRPFPFLRLFYTGQRLRSLKNTDSSILVFVNEYRSQ